MCNLRVKAILYEVTLLIILYQERDKNGGIDMPFILSKESTPINAEQETKLKSGLGKAISLIPGKNEEYLNKVQCSP